MNDGCIHDGAAPHHEARLLKSFLDVIENCFSKVVLLQQMSELQQGGCIRYLLLQEVDPDEVPHSVAVVDRILKAFVRQVEPDLKQVHPEHYFDPARRTAALPGGIVRQNLADPVSPWNDLVHFTKELLLLCDALPSTVFHVAEGHLIHDLNPLNLLAPWHFIIPETGLNYHWKC